MKTMSRAEPKVKAMEEEINRVKEIIKKDAAEIKRLTANVEKITKSLHDTEEKLKVKVVEVTKMKRCRLCLAGNMTPRSRENFVRKSMMKRYAQIAGGAAGGLVGVLLGPEGKEKPRADFFSEALAESEKESGRKGIDGSGGGPDDEGGTAGGAAGVGGPHGSGAGAGAGAAADVGDGLDGPGGGGGGGPDGFGGGVGADGPDGSGGRPGAGPDGSVGDPGAAAAGAGGGSQIVGAQVGKYRSSTVISFLRAALLKRSQRPTLDEAASKQVAEEMAAARLSPEPDSSNKEEKETQTDAVTVTELGEFASVLKRSASCPTRLFWIEEIATPEQRARHRSWMEEQGLVDPDAGKREGDQAEEENLAGGDDDEVEIVVADKPVKQPEGEDATATAGGEPGVKEKRSWSLVHKAMKSKVNKLANDTLDALGSLGDEIGELAGGAEVAFRMAALISKWKKVAKTTGLRGAGEAGAEGGEGSGEGGSGGEGGAGGDSEDFEWEDYEAEDGDEGDGRGRRKRRGRPAMRKGSSVMLDDGSVGFGRTRKSILTLDREPSLGSKSSSRKSMKTSYAI